MDMFPPKRLIGFSPLDGESVNSLSSQLLIRLRPLGRLACLSRWEAAEWQALPPPLLLPILPTHPSLPPIPPTHSLFTHNYSAPPLPQQPSFMEILTCCFHNWLALIQLIRPFLSISSRDSLTSIQQRGVAV